MLIKVQSIFKGELSDSTFIIETFGGTVGDNFHFSPHTIGLQKGYQGYFFLTKDLGFVSYENGFAFRDSDFNPQVRFAGKMFSKQQFEEGIIATTKYPKLSVAEYFNLRIIENTKGRDRDTCNIITSRVKKSIAFSFKNVKYTENFQYIEFDVKVKVNTPGLKFGKANLYVKYSKHFGENAISSKEIQVSKGKMIQNSLYALTSTDVGSQSFGISILPKYGSNSLYTFTESEEDLVHVKAKITDFTSIGSISFDDIDISGEVFYWCQGAYGLFDETNLSEPIKATNGIAGSTIGITYTFENAIYNSSFNTFSVNLFAKATAPSKYAQAFIYIDYNDLGFGKDVVKNGTFQFTQQDLLANSAVYKVFPKNEDSNTLSLIVFSEGDPDDLANLGTTPRNLGKLTFNVTNCNEPKNINFNPLTLINLNSHSTGNMPVTNEQYDPVIANDPENGTICGCKKPVITSFSPMAVRGGVGEILTITGQNFGTFVFGTSTVLFKNGDDMGPKEIEVGSLDFRWDDIIHWTDTEIKIKVPGCDKAKGSNRPPATGNIKVRNICEISDESMQKVDIPYSVLNYRGSLDGKAKRLNLQSNSPNSSICFQFSEKIPSWIFDQFQGALIDWCSETSINFKIGASIKNNTPLGLKDNINLVSYSESDINGVSGVPAAMFVTNFYFETNKCIDESLYFSEIDFVLRATLTSPSIADEKKVREYIAHELGHAHMLNHAKGFDQLMQPNGNSGNGITLNDQVGANLVFAASAACGPKPIGEGQCGMSCGTGINAIQEETIEGLQIFPNPVSKILSVSSSDNSWLVVDIINAQGICVKSTENSNSEHLIDVSDLPSGIYICKVSNGKIINYKIFVKI